MEVSLDDDFPWLDQGLKGRSVFFPHQKLNGTLPTDP